MSIDGIYARSFIVVLSLALLGFLAYSYVPLATGGGYVHPDVGETLLVSANLLENRAFVMEEPLNDLFEYDLFTRQASASLHEDRSKIVPVGYLGRYLLYGASLGLGELAPFLLTSLLGSVSVVGFYLVLKEAFGSEGVALLGSGILAFFPSLMYWSSTILANVPALAGYIASLYGATRALKTGELKWYLATAILMSATIFLRYEYVVAAIIVILFALATRDTVKIRYLLVAILVGILSLTPIPVLNQLIYGEALTVGYIQSGASVEAGLSEIVSPPGPNPITLATNFRIEYLQRYPHIILMSLAGIVLVLKGRGKMESIQRFFLASTLGFSLFLLYWFGVADGYAGYGTDILISSYSRYLMPTFLPLIALSAFSLNRLVRRLAGWKSANPRGSSAILLVTVLLAANTLWSVSYATTAPFGLQWMGETAQEWKGISETVERTTPSDAVIITDLYSTVVLSRKVLWPYRMPLDDIDEKLPNYVRTLLEMDRPVYLLEEPRHPWYLDIESTMRENGQFSLTVVNEEPRIVRVNTPKM
ncbi:MAG: glycosyltransferase family 39 protein [Thermoplasmata archaeon]